MQLMDLGIFETDPAPEITDRTSFENVQLNDGTDLRVAIFTEETEHGIYSIGISIGSLDLPEIVTVPFLTYLNLADVKPTGLVLRLEDAVVKEKRIYAIAQYIKQNCKVHISMEPGNNFVTVDIEIDNYRESENILLEALEPFIKCHIDSK